MYISPAKMKLLLNLYPPYLGTGIHISHIKPDWSQIQVRMKLRWFNRNAVGSHFGGSLFSMVDPQLMLMLMQILGREYIVWDKSACIEFVKPAKQTVFANIQISTEQIQEIRTATRDGEKYLPKFEILINNQENELIARVSKLLYIRKKR